jgi:hypothetical protein
METLLVEIVTLAILAIPVACVSWTVTHEEVFREPREFCACRSRDCRSLVQRKFFYLFTCEYCFSHYVVVLFLILTRFHMLYDDWRGYVIAGFALVWIANQYMSLYNRLRLDIRAERNEAVLKERVIEKASEQPAPAGQAAARR